MSTQTLWPKMALRSNMSHDAARIINPPIQRLSIMSCTHEYKHVACVLTDQSNHKHEITLLTECV